MKKIELTDNNSYALKLYQKACANTWFPGEISLANDKLEYETKLSEMERHYFKYMLGFFSTAESLVANNINHALYKHMPTSEERLFLIRQAYEEANHAMTFKYIIESLGLDTVEVIKMADNIPEIKAKEKFEEQFTKDLDKDQVTDKELFRNLFGFYAIMEGLFFFSGFLIGLSFGRRQLLKGSAGLVQYILRDECHSEDTEILTPRGWVMFPDLKDGEPVYQYNEDGSMSEVVPDTVVRNPKIGKMYLVEHERWAGLVTPNHDLVYKTVKNNTLKKQHIEDFKYTSERLVPQVSKLDNIEGIKLSTEEKLLIALSADGSILKTNNGNIRGKNGGYNVSMSIKKEYKIEKLEYLLKNFNYSKKEAKNGKFTYTFYLNNPTKDLSWAYKRIKSLNEAKEFIEEVSIWDSHIRDKDRIIFCSTNIKNVDVVQWVSTLCGYTTKLTVSEDNRKDTYKDYYRLSINKDPKEFISAQNIKSKVVDYNGKVYCVSVPSGMLITRYKGKNMIAGNTIHLGFGMQAMRKMIKENPSLLDNNFRAELTNLTKEAVDLEIKYAKRAMPEGILGMNNEYYSRYCKYIADRRLSSLGMDTIYNVQNPAMWLTTQTDLPTLNSFFEANTEASYEINI